MAASLSVCLVFVMTGCSPLKAPSAAGLDLMSPGLLMPGLKTKKGTQYQLPDGSISAKAISDDGSMTMQAHQKIQEAKAQNAIVLQVAGDEQPIRVLPLPPGGRSVFVSELLTQTGVLRRLGAVDASLYRPSKESISGIKMEVKFAEDGSVDPASDYGLRPGDRVQVRAKTNSPIQKLVDIAMQR
jgi:hypothetical protein